jgi:hypothetical protein
MAKKSATLYNPPILALFSGKAKLLLAVLP